MISDKPGYFWTSAFTAPGEPIIENRLVRPVCDSQGYPLFYETDTAFCEVPCNHPSQTVRA